MGNDLAAWKFITQNLVATYTVTWKINLAYFLKSILSIVYIVLNIGNAGL